MIFVACFSPNWVLQKYDVSSGKVVSTFQGSAKFLDPSTFEGIDDLISKGVRKVLVPCGRCIGCRIDYSRQWSSRLCIELKDNDSKAIFVTLTYDNDHLPFADVPGSSVREPCLSVRDCQLFFKRLRKKFSDRRIRFYIAGEYGTRTKRPHYHAIIFGLSLSDFPDLVVRSCNDLKQPYFSSDLLHSIWKNGFCGLSEVSLKTCAYVARYCCKKFFRLLDGEFEPVVPEFSLCSRRPGIGLLNARQLVESEVTRFFVQDMNGVGSYFLPKSVFNKGLLDLMRDDPALAASIWHDRLISAEQSVLYDGSYTDFLRTSERSLLSKIRLLKDGANE